MTKAEKQVVRAAMRLYQGRRLGLKWPASGFDREGAYWIVRDNRVTREFRTACARLAARKRKRS